MILSDYEIIMKSRQQIHWPKLQISIEIFIDSLYQNKVIFQ